MLSSLRKWRAQSTQDAAIRADLKARVVRIFGLESDDAVSVNEIACGDPGCGDVETIILFMREGEPTYSLKVPAQMADVLDGDLERLAAIDTPCAPDQRSR